MKNFNLAPVVLLLLFLLIPLACIGLAALIVAALLVQILRLALLREEWEASRNLLVWRWRLLGFSGQREHRDAALVIEPHYEQGRRQPLWRLSLRPPLSAHQDETK